MLPYHLFPGTDTVVYLIGSEGAEEIFRLLPEPKPTLIAVTCTNCNRQLSPWPAPPAFRNSEAFAGEADAFLHELTELLPQVEADIPVRCRMLCGYSLAGLFALWAGGQSELFQVLGSFSGSLWYPDALPFLQTLFQKHPPQGVVLSLGDRESHTRNPVLSRVEECTLAFRDFLQSEGIPVRWQMHPGNHFENPSGRIAAGIAKMMQIK